MLGTQASAQLLWQLAEVEVQAGIEALEEAVKSGILREEEAGGGRLGSYRFSHDLMRDVVYTELGAARRQVLHQRAFAVLDTEGARASELAYHARASGQAEAPMATVCRPGMRRVAVFAVAGRHRALRTGARLAAGVPAAADQTFGSRGRTPLCPPGTGLCLSERLGAGPGDL